ncbi:hypothetical protein [Labilithrix luteola]|uniref:hypothetical protein n=1 Tax=Labilithrix luteola TaxID=1391654 RepID=UPI0011BA4CEA|nr:hypothetical protein [Labilithrix luteola]
MPILIAGAGLAGLLGAQDAFGQENAPRTEQVPIVVRTVEHLHARCPTSPPLLERLTARLDRVREARPGEPAVRVEIRVEEHGDLSSGKLTLGVGAERAEREASSPSCEEVIAALAVMAAIGLDENVPPVEEPPPSPPPPTVAMQPSAGKAPPRAPVAAEPPRAAVMTVSLGTGVQSSTNRALVVMPTLFGEIGWRTAVAPSLRIGVGRSFSHTFSTSRGGASVQWTEAIVDACSEFLRGGDFHGGVCATGEVGQLRAEVEPPLHFPAQSRWWVTAGASARVAWQFHPRLSLEVSGGARMPIVADRLFFEPNTEVYDAPAIIGFFGAAFVARLR